MGTSETVPIWALEISMMEAFGWTERQLDEEVSLGMVKRIQVLFNLREKAAKMKEKEQLVKAKMKGPTTSHGR